MSYSSDLVGTSAVVTGVSRGIGRAIAIGLAEAGANVVGVHFGDTADHLVRRLDQIGRDYEILEADAGQPETAQSLAEIALARWGSVDVWVNNAARLMVKPLVETTDDDWHGLLAANLHGYFYGCRAAAEAMYTNRRGCIINVTSAAGILAVENLSAYATAKGGVLTLTKTLALEAAKFGVTVNAVAPGAIDTELNREAYTPEVRATYEERIPLGRIGDETEVADVVCFLASTGARYITGQEIVVDGGLVINGTVGHAPDGS